MNYSTAIFLINESVRAVICTYEADTPTKQAPREVFKTFDQDIKVGDLVVVPTTTRHGMTVVKVVEVDIEPDLESATQIDWIVSRVDRGPYDKVLAGEAQAIDTIKSAEKRRKREALRASILADQESTLMALPIASVGDLPEGDPSK